MVEEASPPHRVIREGSVGGIPTTEGESTMIHRQAFQQKPDRGSSGDGARAPGVLMARGTSAVGPSLDQEGRIDHPWRRCTNAAYAVS